MRSVISGSPLHFVTLRNDKLHGIDSLGVESIEEDE